MVWIVDYWLIDLYDMSHDWWFFICVITIFNLKKTLWLLILIILRLIINLLLINQYNQLNDWWYLTSIIIDLDITSHSADITIDFGLLADQFIWWVKWLFIFCICYHTIFNLKKPQFSITSHSGDLRRMVGFYRYEWQVAQK